MIGENSSGSDRALASVPEALQQLGMAFVHTCNLSSRKQRQGNQLHSEPEDSLSYVRQTPSQNSTHDYGTTTQTLSLFYSLQMPFAYHHIRHTHLLTEH